MREDVVEGLVLGWDGFVISLGVCGRVCGSQRILEKIALC